MYLWKMTHDMLLDALRWRYATNKFDPNRILDEIKLQQILNAGNLTATSFGLQPFKIVVLEGAEWREKLQSVTFYQDSIQTCSHLLVLCGRTDMDEGYIDDYVEYIEQSRSLSGGTLNKYAEVSKTFLNQKDELGVQSWVSRQVYIVLGNLLTTCALLGVDSCPMEGFIPHQLDGILGLNSYNLRSVLLLPIGYRSEEDPFAGLKKVRKPLEEMVIKL